MKKDSFKLIIMSVAVICIVIAGIMVPGIVLEANQKSEHDHVAKVPKSYLPSGSVMAKEASANLKLSEKLSLIDGQWDSTTDDAASYEMDEQDYQAVATCRKSIEKLYEEKLMAEEGLKKTKNDLIHIGCPIPFDINEFLDELDGLLDAAYRNEDDMKERVQKIVSTYHPA